MTAAVAQPSSRRRLHIAAISILALAVTAVGASPATAVPASVPSVNYNIGRSINVISYNYGEKAPSPRSLIISAETRELVLTIPFPLFDILTCSMSNQTGGTVASSQTFRNDENEGPTIAKLAIAPGRVIAGSRATFFIDCRDGYANLAIARFLLTEGAGAGISASYPGSDSKLASVADFDRYGPDIFLPGGSSGSGQTVVPGNRVRAYGSVGTFRTAGYVNKATVTITSGSTTVTALDISIIDDGSIIGFTVPAGLAAGRIDFAVKTVATLGQTVTTPKINRVVKWSDHAIFDPNLDGKSLTLTPYPSITGKPRIANTLTAETGTWQPAPVTLSYVWLRDGVVIAGATTSTYRTRAADSGYDISVAVTGTKSGFRSTTRTSPPIPITG